LARTQAQGGDVTDSQASWTGRPAAHPLHAGPGLLLLAVSALLLVGAIAPTAASAQDVVAYCDTPAARDTCDRWYTTSWVSLSWQPDPGGMIVSGCNNGSFVAETKPQPRSCTVMWGGTTEEKQVWIGIDRTPPRVVSYQTDRPPDYNGWFNHPVGLRFQGTDATSGVASCSSTTYGGPDGQGVMVGGSCRDVAGHTGVGALPLNYDATPPPAPLVDSLPGDNRVALEWTTSPDSQAEVVRGGKEVAPVVVYRGPGGAFTDRGLRNGQRYRYAVSLIDQAGNRAAGTTSAVPTSSKLLEPAKGERIRIVQLPLLIWKRVRKADYYNVQIFRGRRKVLSSWPRQPRFQVKRRWRYGGRQYRLVPGKYCWYVWPGHGRRAKRDYGKRLGKSCFRIVR
jgi:hypothetical protein